MVTRVRPADIWRVPTRDSLSARGSTRLAFVEDENTTWIFEPGSALDPSDSVVTAPTGQWHIIANGEGGGGGSASYVATDEWRRMPVTATPDDGDTTIPFGITIPVDSEEMVGVYKNGLRLTQETDPLSLTGFKVNVDRQGITIGQAADGDDIFVMLVPVELAENFSIYNDPLVEAGDTVEIAAAVDIVSVYLNGARINEGVGALEWQFAANVLTVTGGWDDDHLVVEYSTVALGGAIVNVDDVADGEVYQRDGDGVTGVSLTVLATTDIGDLDADVAPESAEDYVAVWDTSSGTYTKVLLDDLPFSAGGHTEVHTEGAALGIAVYSRTVSHDVYMHGILGGDGIQTSLVGEDVRIDITSPSDIAYTPLAPENWTEGAPDDVGEALDLLAARDSGGGGVGVGTKAVLRQDANWFAGSSTTTTVPFDTILSDPFVGWNIVDNTFTVPADMDGVYAFYVNVVWTTAGATNRGVWTLEKSDGGGGWDEVSRGEGDNLYARAHATRLMQSLVAGDVVRIRWTDQSGTGKNVTATSASGSWYQFMMIEKVA